MSINIATEGHEVNEAGYCVFCDQLINSKNDTAYCRGRGYYSTSGPGPGFKSQSAWKKLGYKVIKGQRPAGYIYGVGLPSKAHWFAVYSIFQTEKIVQKTT